MKIYDKAELNNGTKIPYLGFGTYNLLPDETAKRAVMDAFEAGYRHIDTASVYGTEKGVGEAINSMGIPRNELFITTKVWNDEQGYDSTFKAFDRSLNRLKCDYIDLYLIHWPVSSKRNETWRALKELVKNKSCKAIGVSNYNIKHLNELLSLSEIVPAVNQVEFNPFLYQKELYDFCRQYSIQIVAYTPIVRNRKSNNILLQELSKKYNKTPAQLMIRWCLQHKLPVIPRSSNRQRIIENADVFDFEISDEDMQRMNGLNEGYRTSANPDEYE